tara:strand:- start:192 stop:761 length:570 start_codon:yes stop_codon:yes gene_type:complete
MPGSKSGLKVDSLTEKQRRFVEAYLGEADGNAYEAAKIAGYGGNKRSLEVIGSENLRKPEIRKAIDARTQTGGLVATREERQAFLTKVMRAETRRMPERLKAAEMLCKMHGDFTERHMVDMTVNRQERERELAIFLTELKARDSARKEQKKLEASVNTIPLLNDTNIEPAQVIDIQATPIDKQTTTNES